MNSPADTLDWQFPADVTTSCGLWSCNHAQKHQIITHAQDVSPSFVMVFLSHFPSPFWARFSAYVSELGHFFWSIPSSIMGVFKGMIVPFGSGETALVRFEKMHQNMSIFSKRFHKKYHLVRHVNTVSCGYKNRQKGAGDVQ